MKILISAICNLLIGKREMESTFLEILRGPCLRKVTYWSSEDFSISTGLRLNLQSQTEKKHKSRDLEGEYELKVFASDGFGTGKGKFNNDADGYFGETHYESIIPIENLEAKG